eukprot:GFYU01003698.1.p2 GENE.GFYU01003698.1~~GFYU01003698.1.p2  ORF type:complete len:124 (-),score=13.60 GFYU01003698.1:34-405(-)
MESTSNASATWVKSQPIDSIRGRVHAADVPASDGVSSDGAGSTVWSQLDAIRDNVEEKYLDLTRKFDKASRQWGAMMSEDQTVTLQRLRDSVDQTSIESVDDANISLEELVALIRSDIQASRR